MKRSILIRPYITEKTLSLTAKGWYTFRVSVKSNKAEIADAVTSMYKVTVVNVRSSFVHGKSRRVGKRMKQVAQPDWKKAIVHVASGQTIDAFHTVTEEGKT